MLYPIELQALGPASVGEEMGQHTSFARLGVGYSDVRKSWIAEATAAGW